MTYIIVAAVAVIAVFLASATISHGSDIDSLKERVNEVIKVSNANTQVTGEKLKRIESVLDSQVAITAHEDEEIQNIIKRMDSFEQLEHDDIWLIIKRLEDIVKDINELDKEVEQIKHDEKDLRTYYVNYREPVTSDHGVEWASEYRTGEDNE